MRPDIVKWFECGTKYILDYSDHPTQRGTKNSNFNSTDKNWEGTSVFKTLVPTCVIPPRQNMNPTKTVITNNLKSFTKKKDITVLVNHQYYTVY